MAVNNFTPLKNLEKRILPSVVTFAGDWRQMIKEVRRLNLSVISLFVTTVEPEERQEIYQALLKTKVKLIPHVYIRHDMLESEMDFLAKKYKTSCFSVHYQFLKNFEASKHLAEMFIETNEHESRIKSRRPLNRAGGLCIDLSHLDTYRQKDKHYYNYCLDLARQYHVGCNHLSAGNFNGLASHLVNQLTDLNYLLDMPSYCFSNYICFELGNPIKDQLQFKKYLVKLLSTRHKNLR